MSTSNALTLMLSISLCFACKCVYINKSQKALFIAVLHVSKKSFKEVPYIAHQQA